MGKVVKLKKADPFANTEFEGNGDSWLAGVPADPEDLSPESIATIKKFVQENLGAPHFVRPFDWFTIAKHAFELYKLGAPELWAAQLIAAYCYHWPEDHAEEIARRVRAVFGQANYSDSPLSLDSAQFELEDLDDMERDPPVKWLLDLIIIAGGLFVVHAPEKVGKTFLTLALALCKATGRDFAGMKVEPGRVVYIIAEGNRGAFTRRVKAWIIANSTPGEDRNALRALVKQNFRRVAKPVLVDNLAQVTAFVSAIAWLKEDDESNGLVVVDTLNRNLEGHVSDPKDMQAFVRGCDLIRSSTGATVIAVHHHSNKPGARDMFGSKNLAFSMDGSLHLIPKADGIYAQPERVRDAEDGQLAIVFRLKPVRVPVESDAGSAALTLDDMDAALAKAQPNSAVFEFIARREIPKKGSQPLSDAPPADAKFAILETIRNDAPENRADLIAMFDGEKSRATITRALAKLRKDGLLEKEALKLTKKGADYLDNVSDESESDDEDE